MRWTTTTEHEVGGGIRNLPRLPTTMRDLILGWDDITRVRRICFRALAEIGLDRDISASMFMQREGSAEVARQTPSSHTLIGSAILEVYHQSDVVSWRESLRP
jgi:hypothetical protein